eukprot:273693-Amphidinium_carterae.1
MVAKSMGHGRALESLAASLHVSTSTKLKSNSASQCVFHVQINNSGNLARKDLQVASEAM